MKQKTMNDVVFVMANSRLAKKKQERKPHDFECSLDELNSDEEWIVDEEDVLENLEDLDIPNDLVAQGEGGSGSVGPKDDLAIPDLDDDDFDELIRRDGHEDRDHIEDEEYDDHGLNDLL